MDMKLTPATNFLKMLNAYDRQTFKGDLEITGFFCTFRTILDHSKYAAHTVHNC